MSSQRQNARVLTYWSLLHQRLEKLFAVKKNLSRRLQRVWESKLWKNNWLAVVYRRESFQPNLNNPVGREETFYKHFSLIMSNNFWYQTFVALSGNLGGKVPNVDDGLSSHDPEIYPTTSLDKNCIDFQFQTDRNYYVVLRQSLWHWSSNLSKSVVTIHTRVRKRRRSTKMSRLFWMKQAMTKKK